MNIKKTIGYVLIATGAAIGIKALLPKKESADQNTNTAPTPNPMPINSNTLPQGTLPNQGTIPSPIVQSPLSNTIVTGPVAVSGDVYGTMPNIQQDMLGRSLVQNAQLSGFSFLGN